MYVDALAGIHGDVAIRDCELLWDYNGSDAVIVNSHVLYESVYEDKVLGRLSEERFLKLSAKYEDEQSAVWQNIKHLRAIVDEESAHEMNADGFLNLARKYNDIDTLTPEILREFIDKIVMHHREQLFGETIQEVEIYYRMVGYIELPELTKEQKVQLELIFGRDMEKAG